MSLETYVAPSKAKSAAAQVFQTLAIGLARVDLSLRNPAATSGASVQSSLFHKGLSYLLEFPQGDLLIFGDF